MSKLNRKEFKKILTEWKQNFVHEMSRANKIYFNKNKHSSLKGESEVLFIHWLRPYHKSEEDNKYKKTDARRYMKLGSERLEEFIENKLNKQEVSCNLLAPKLEKKNYNHQFTHNYNSGENWGYLGVVIKGYPTLGSLKDNNSTPDLTQSGTRVRSYGWNREENKKDKNYIDYESIDKLNNIYNLEDKDAFFKEQEIEYSDTEFFVKPSKILSAVFYIQKENALEGVIDQKLFDAETDSIYKNICEYFSEDTEKQVKIISGQEISNVKKVCNKNNIELKVDPDIDSLNMISK